MSAIKDIREAENKAEEILLNANKEKNEILKSAEVSVKTTIEETEKNCGILRENLLTEARSKADAEIELLSQQYQHNNETLKTKASDNMGAAINLIIKKVVI